MTHLLCYSSFFCFNFSFLVSISIIFATLFFVLHVVFSFCLKHWTGATQLFSTSLMFFVFLVLWNALDFLLFGFCFSFAGHYLSFFISDANIHKKKVATEKNNWFLIYFCRFIVYMISSQVFEGGFTYTEVLIFLWVLFVTLWASLV